MIFSFWNDLFLSLINLFLLLFCHIHIINAVLYTTAILYCFIFFKYCSGKFLSSWLMCEIKWYAFLGSSLIVHASINRHNSFISPESISGFPTTFQCDVLLSHITLPVDTQLLPVIFVVFLWLSIGITHQYFFQSCLLLLHLLFSFVYRVLSSFLCF